LGVLTELYNKRVPIYGLADLQIHVKPGCAIEQTAQMVLDVLCTRPDVLEKVE
jgi:shikimate kinase